MTATLSAAYGSALRNKRIVDTEGALGEDAVDSFRRILAEAHMAPHEAVGLSLDNSRESLAAYIACGLQDLVVVGLPQNQPPAERRELWMRLGCRYAIEKNGLVPLDPGRAKITWPTDIRWIVHSSGSTGIPKAIPLTETMVRQNAEDTMSVLGFGGDLLHMGSMSHCYTNGLFNSFLLPLLTGGRSVIAPVASALSFRRWLDVVAKLKPNLLWVNPTVVKMMVAAKALPELSFVKALLCCTAPLTSDVAIAAEDRLGRPVLQSFGLSETLITTMESPGRDPRKEFSSGVVVGGPACLRVEEGVAVIENGAVTLGYASIRNDKPVFDLPQGVSGRKFVTADLVEIDSVGRVRIVGRTSAVANVQGEKIGLERIEDTARGTAGVLDAIAVALPDQATGERPVLLVTAIAPIDAETVADAVVAAVGPRARPAAVYRIDAIPLTANGKPSRALAKDIASRLYAAR